MGEWNAVISTAVFIALVHTLIGVDHYIPFVALAKANAWSTRKTLLIVFACGLGHVLSSAVLGLLGIGLSQSLNVLVDIESLRGELATYFMIGFGLIYTIWAIRSSLKHKSHTHLIQGEHIRHSHHERDAFEDHPDSTGKKQTNTLWGLFILFVLGPCEPLIPLMMIPAARGDGAELMAVLLGFSVCTIATMLTATWIGIQGLKAIKFQGLDLYAQPLAGLALTLCGVLILTLGI